MKRLSGSLAAVLLIGLSFLNCPAYAGNSKVEATLQSFGDLSMFYQAMLNTGLINEMTENQHYTVFAPTNAAFASLTPQTYPCFYSAQCRPQIASLLRAHFIIGAHDLNDLITYGQGIQSAGGPMLFVGEPYVNDYTVDGKHILSKTENDGNIIYRIDGVLAKMEDLTVFQTVRAEPPMGPTSSVITERSVTTYAPPQRGMQPYPGGDMTVTSTGPAPMPDNLTEVTTISRDSSVVVQPQ